MELRGAVTVVTGASSGLGRRFAIDLASAGALVVGLARRGDLLAALEPELRRASPGSQTLVCDVSATDHYAAVLAELEEEHGRIDVLINNAGMGQPPDARPDASAAERLRPFRDVMETNYFAAVAGTLAVLPGMLDRGHGAVVNVSSDTARAPGPGEGAYGASKAALSAFTESMSFHTEPRGVSLHLLYPGWVPTAMGAAGGGPPPPKMVRRSEQQVSKLLLERLGTRRVDIDAAPIARLAPLARALAPGLYRRGVRTAGG